MANPIRSSFDIYAWKDKIYHYFPHWHLKRSYTKFLTKTKMRDKKIIIITSTNTNFINKIT